MLDGRQASAPADSWTGSCRSGISGPLLQSATTDDNDEERQLSLLSVQPKQEALISRLFQSLHILGIFTLPWVTSDRPGVTVMHNFKHNKECVLCESEQQAAGWDGEGVLYTSNHTDRVDCSTFGCVSSEDHSLFRSWMISLLRKVANAVAIGPLEMHEPASMLRKTPPMATGQTKPLASLKLCNYLSYSCNPCSFPSPPAKHFTSPTTLGLEMGSDSSQSASHPGRGTTPPWTSRDPKTFPLHVPERQ